MLELREQMREASEDGDEEEVQALREQMRALMGAPQNQESLDAALTKIGDVLTEEQKPAFEALVTEAKANQAERPGFRGPGERGRGEERGEGRRSGRPGPRGQRRAAPAPTESDAD
jgi:hypothetical protein